MELENEVDDGVRDLARQVKERREPRALRRGRQGAPRPSVFHRALELALHQIPRHGLELSRSQTPRDPSGQRPDAMGLKRILEDRQRRGNGLQPQHDDAHLDGSAFPRGRVQRPLKQRNDLARILDAEGDVLSLLPDPLAAAEFHPLAPEILDHRRRVLGPEGEHETQAHDGAQQADTRDLLWAQGGGEREEHGARRSHGEGLTEALDEGSHGLLPFRREGLQKQVHVVEVDARQDRLVGEKRDDGGRHARLGEERANVTMYTRG